MTSTGRGLLEGRGSGSAIFILFSCLGAWSWASITSSHQLTHSPIYVAGLLFATFIAGSVAYRSPLSMDRAAFGAAAAAFLLATVATTLPLGPTAVTVVRAAKSVMWTIAAAVGLVVLVRGGRKINRNG